MAIICLYNPANCGLQIEETSPYWHVFMCLTHLEIYQWNISIIKS